MKKTRTSIKSFANLTITRSYTFFFFDITLGINSTLIKFMSNVTKKKVLLNLDTIQNTMNAFVGFFVFVFIFIYLFFFVNMTF